MAQRLVTSFINTNIPGAYPNITVQSNPVALGQSGIVVIFGEAVGGNSYQNVSLKNNSFTPDQLAKVQQTYISGQIVDAFTAFAAPSNDADITGSANLIYIVKTNSGTQASAIVDTNYGTLRDQNWGLPGNNYSYQITNTAMEAAPAITGTAVPSYGATTGAQFTVRVNGGAALTIAGLAASANQAALVTNLNSAFATATINLSAVAGTAPNTIELVFSETAGSSVPVADAAANRKGWGKAFELIDSTPGDLAALGLAAGLSVSSQEPAIEVQINNASTGLSETLNVSEDIALSIGYLGTTGTITISATTLTTTVTGGSGGDLSIALSQYKTIATLAAFINNQPGYTASAAASVQQVAPSSLDQVTAVGIATSTSGDEPGRIKDGAANFNAVLATSTALSFTPEANLGLPSSMATPAFLSGGTRGATLAADIINVIDQLAGINVNIVIPLFSEDASLDIAAGTTDPASTYTIDAINAATKNHCIQYSTPKLKKNRICILSLQDTYANAKQEAQSLANYRCSLTMQQSIQVNSVGVITTFLPWYAACIAAGMQTGGFYKSITNKYGNVISFIDPSGFDSGSPGDVEDALDAGLLFLTQDTAGSRWVSDQTTYGFDTNFVYNSIQAVYTSDILALDLAASFQSAFVGQSLADVNAATALSFLAQKMDGYKKLKLIAASSDAPLGYKNQSVSIQGPEMDVAVEIKLATAIYFVPISINISEVQSSAG